MDKKTLGNKSLLYPMPVTLVGANVAGKPNYLTAAWVGIVNREPPMISVALNKRHYTNVGIRENGTFSVNIPSAAMVEATDYCGIVSGYRDDKSDLFDTFYGKLGTAPMIRECPLCLECRVVHVLAPASHETFIGEIVACYTEERYLTDGAPDPRKLDLMVYTHFDRSYWRVGEFVGKAWSIGKGYRSTRSTAS